MTRVSTLIGFIKNPEPVFDRTIGDETFGDQLEKFYTVECELRKSSIPLLISEHNLDCLVKGKVSITGSLFSDYVDIPLPKSYIYVNKIEPVSPDTDLTNEVNFSGTVTVVRDMTVDSVSRDTLPIVVANTSPLNTPSILLVTLKDGNARRNKGKKPKFNISGTGYLLKYKDVYEIHAKNIVVS